MSPEPESEPESEPEIKIYGADAPSGSADAWQRLLERLNVHLTTWDFGTWFANGQLVDDDGRTITIAMSANRAKWILKHYRGLLAKALHEIGRSDSRIRFVAPSDTTIDDHECHSSRGQRRRVAHGDSR